MRIGTSLLALASGFVLWGGSTAWAQKDPQPKSQKEIQALQNYQQQTTVDGRLQAIDDILTKFADTEFKAILLQEAVQLEQQKGDSAMLTTYAERLLQVDPKSPYAHLAMATDLAAHTREFDLDKDDKLTKAEKYANAAIQDLKDYPKPMSRMPDDQWTLEKKNLTNEGYLALGMVAMDRKKYDDAITQYKAAIDAYPDANANFRLGEAYLKAGKADDAIAQFDKVLAMTDANPTVKQFAQQRKNEAMKAKAGSK
jgi:tetratricopeptide (TPR) repeat protein